MTDLPIKAPGGFAPATAIGHTDAAGNYVPVGPDNPLPVAGLSGPASAPPPAALTGDTASPEVAGPYAPVRGRTVFVQLSGEWTGSARLLRSVDGGTTKHLLTAAGSEWAVFASNVCEAVWEEGESGAQLYLDLAPTSGTIAYRVSQ
ncbi:hypothetical protein [Qipengyuania atrilutea]|uniref:Uncharacterized protein n=1 Tax=Qipengyuania atrilutea TaxID=2744473 RepID=A0A850H4J6_9SPHN|nr:hypothetical protein [Actirhodobacter atriluteus]NVD44793.1 hypothetical protein [Actirhodobacter atriluteus]